MNTILAWSQPRMVQVLMAFGTWGPLGMISLVIPLILRTRSARRAG